MQSTNPQGSEALPCQEPTPLELPAERLRKPTSDDQEIDISDPRLDVPFDDDNRLEEDARPSLD